MLIIRRQFKYTLVFIAFLFDCVNNLVVPKQERLNVPNKRDPLSEFLKLHNPECGERIESSSRTFVVNGVPSKFGEYPWHVGIYEKNQDSLHYNYICGGSILSEKSVLSAAHCFTNDNGIVNNASEYFVAAGKYHKNFSSPHDLLAQKRKINHIFKHPNYKGILVSYSYDIAVLEVNESFVMSNVVHPICIDWKSDFEEEQLSLNSYGHVSGWGNTKDTINKDDEGLKVLRVPYIDHVKCIEVVPKGFIRYVTSDKFCAGYENGSSVCNGDSGSGLVFEKLNNNKSIFYVRGLVSVGVQHNGDCDNTKYSTYTRVSEYLTFIRDAITSINLKQNIAFKENA